MVSVKWGPKVTKSDSAWLPRLAAHKGDAVASPECVLGEYQTHLPSLLQGARASDLPTPILPPSTEHHK